MKARTDGKRKRLKDGIFKYGDVEMTDAEYREAQDPKVRTTIFLEASLIRGCKAEALRRGIKYQQFVRDVVRGALGKKDDVEERLERLESLVLKRRA